MKSQLSEPARCLLRCAFTLAALGAVLTGCGGGAQIGAPRQVPIVSPTSPGAGVPTPTASPTASATSAALTADQINASLQSVETTYARLPHTDLNADLTTLAAQMVSTGAYKTADVVDGGISATLPDGTTAAIYADRQETLSGVRRVLPNAIGPTARVRAATTVGPAVAHEIAFLVLSDGDEAFKPSRQAAFAHAFATSGFVPANNYGADALDASLESIVALGSNHPLDLLGIATHGIVVGRFDGGKVVGATYDWRSSTKITSDTLQTYKDDIAAGRLHYGLDLTNVTARSIGSTFTFTPEFLVRHLSFNPGAIVLNQSCSGQSGRLMVGQILSAGGIGRYVGWTRPVGSEDADGTDAFVIDRMLGEQSPSSTGLDLFVPQTKPAQRPLAFDSILALTTTELRTGDIRDTDGTYATSYSMGRTNPSTLLTNNFPASGSDPLIEYGLPSIDHLVGPTNGVLTLFGAFPKAVGFVELSDGSTARSVVATSWATDRISVAVPQSGPGSSGKVRARSHDGIGGNIVPFTGPSPSPPPVMAKAVVSPAYSNVAVNASETLTVSVTGSGFAASDLTYHWQLSGLRYMAYEGHIVDPISGKQDDFTTKSTTVTYTAPARDDYDGVSVTVSGGPGFPGDTSALAAIGVGCDMYTADGMTKHC